jgi:hypothetical protein
MEKSNGYPRAEPREPEAYSQQYVEGVSDEPARLVALQAQPTLSQPGYLLLFVSNGSNGGCSRSHRE